jgi:hypothetical protein
MVRVPSIVVPRLARQAQPAKKNRQVLGLAVRVDSVFSLRAPFDSLRQGLEKAIKVEEAKARGQFHHLQHAPPTRGAKSQDTRGCGRAASRLPLTLIRCPRV